MNDELVRCPVCEGTGTVDGPGGEERCYECGGAGEIPEPDNRDDTDGDS